MRLLAVADIHYSLRQYDWVLSVADRFDAVVLAGDLLEISSPVDRRAQIVVVRTWLQDLVRRTRVLVSSGNHDLDGPDASGEQRAGWIAGLSNLGIASDSASAMLGGTLFTACAWWDGGVSREAIGRQLAEAAARSRDRWIWVYHAPPAESPVSWAGKRHYGDHALSDWIAEHRPEVVLSGHVHTSPFVPGGSWADRIGGTWVFNAGQQIGPVPAHIVLDLGRGAAGWSSIYGEGWADLGGPRLAVTRGQLPDWLRA